MARLPSRQPRRGWTVTSGQARAADFDTSYVLKLYLDERGSEDVRRLAATTDRLACAWHGQAEVMASFHRKLREGTINGNQLTALVEQYLSESHAGYLLWLPIGQPVMELLTTTVCAAPGNHYLRAADALHLACAAVHGFEVVHANDSHLLAAAPLFGLRGENVIPA